MAVNPYDGLPDSAYWRRSVAQVEPDQLDPVVDFPFRISAQDKIATAGSCFAQHLSNRLQQSGFHYYVTEEAPFFLSDELARENGYGVFTARYGNIYTCRQLWQLMQRAYGEFQSAEDLWQTRDGAHVDPFRPRIQVGGFDSAEECLDDREQHLAAVREAFGSLDVFVFTLGLTECWARKSDGTVFPLCPGVVGGEFDEGKYEFLNLGVQDNLEDMRAFLVKLREINPDCKVILTVSPVPLIASYSPSHVLTATNYSKSVLRVVCEELVQAFDNVAYFPSYEIITGSYSRGRYFADDLRSVLPEGVNHVMRVFMKHCTQADTVNSSGTSGDLLTDIEAALEVLCDEEVLDAEK